MPSHVAERAVDDGNRELVGFLGSPGHRLYAVAHVPADRPRAVVVACPAIYSEQMTSYRTEVLLARRLAVEGVATIRFQYRGTGNSDDAPEDYPTFATMCEDAAAATAWAELVTGGAEATFLGSRLGALVAAHMAASTHGSGLCLIEPALDARRYFRELSRARRAAALRRSDGDAHAPGLGVADEVDAFGSQVGRLTVESFTGRTVEQEMGNAECRVLLVQMSNVSELRHDLAAQAERWQDRGLVVSVAIVRKGRSWWFVPEAWETEEERPETGQLPDAVAGWLSPSEASS